MPQTLSFHSSQCLKHTYVKKGQEIVKPIQNLLIDDKVVCPRCESEKNTEEIQTQIQKQYDEIQLQKKFNIFKRDSILEDKTITQATFNNYKTDLPEEIENKRIVMDVVNRFKSGQVFNLILQGKPGTGKSHLTYASLEELNQSNLNASCLYVNIESMLRKIRDSFNNKQSKYSEAYFVNLLSEVDYLGLDDLGAETGAINSDKAATDFVQRILYAISTTRQDKATLITTNLSSESLFKMYDSKLISRLFNKPKFIVFKETKDKRMTSIPF
jgi:DNA replication protein DnaC